MSSEVKLLQLQKELELTKRKLRDASHERATAIKACNDEWERKFSSQIDILLKRKEVDKQLEITNIQMEINLQKEREVLAIKSENEFEMKKFKELLYNERDSSLKQLKFKSEEKLSETIKHMEDEWKVKENSLTREIFHLSADREKLSSQLTDLQSADMEKASVIKRMNSSHEVAVKDMIELGKQEQMKDYTRYKAMEKLVQEKETEVKRLLGRIDVLKLDKELLEKQLETVKRRVSIGITQSSPRLSGHTSGRNVSDREREQAKRIHNLEDRIKLLQGQQISKSTSNTSLDQPSRPSSRGSARTPFATTPPPSPITPEIDEQINRLKRQKRDLKDAAKKSEDQCKSLELRNSELTNKFNEESKFRKKIEDSVQSREVKMKEKYHVEIEILENENVELSEKVRDLSGDVANLKEQMNIERAAFRTPNYANTQLQEKLDIIQIHLNEVEKKYKIMTKDLLHTQQYSALWSTEVNIGAKNENIVLELQKERDLIKEDLRDVKDEVEALQNMYNNVKNELTASQNEITNLNAEKCEYFIEKANFENEINQNEQLLQDFSDKMKIAESKEKEIANSNQKISSLENNLEQNMRKIGEQTIEISRLRNFEQMFLQSENFKKKSEALKTKLATIESKYSELKDIIRQLEDEISSSQKTLDYKDEVIRALNEKLTTQHVSSNQTVKDSRFLSFLTRTNSVPMAKPEVVFYPKGATLFTKILNNNSNNNNNNDIENNNNNNNALESIPTLEGDLERANETSLFIPFDGARLNDRVYVESNIMPAAIEETNTSNIVPISNIVPTTSQVTFSTTPNATQFTPITTQFTPITTQFTPITAQFTPITTQFTPITTPTTFPIASSDTNPHTSSPPTIQSSALVNTTPSILNPSSSTLNLTYNFNDMNSPVTPFKTESGQSRLISPSLKYKNPMPIRANSYPQLFDTCQKTQFTPETYLAQPNLSIPSLLPNLSFQADNRIDNNTINGASVISAIDNNTSTTRAHSATNNIIPSHKRNNKNLYDEMKQDGFPLSDPYDSKAPGVLVSGGDQLGPTSINAIDQNQNNNCEISTNPKSNNKHNNSNNDTISPFIDVSQANISTTNTSNTPQKEDPQPFTGGLKSTYRRVSPDVSPILTPERDTKQIKPTPDLFLIKYDYDPLVSSPNKHPEDELPLKAGRFVYIYGQPDKDGFLSGELPSGKTGLVPSNFVEKLDTSISEAPVDTQTGAMSEDEASYSFDDDRDNSFNDSPLNLYIHSTTQGTSGTTALHDYNTNLSNIMEEDESFLDESNLTKISGNMSSNDSLDKVSKIEKFIPSLEREEVNYDSINIEPPKDVKIQILLDAVSVEISWSLPLEINPKCQGYKLYIDNEEIQFVRGFNLTSYVLPNIMKTLSSSKHTLAIRSVVDSKLSKPAEVIFDTREIPSPSDLKILPDPETEECIIITWKVEGLEDFASQVSHFHVNINETQFCSIDYFDFMNNLGLSMVKRELEHFAPTSIHTPLNLSVKSVLEDGRESKESKFVPLPDYFLKGTRFDTTPPQHLLINLSEDKTVVSKNSSARLLLNNAISEDVSDSGSNHSFSSESEVLEVFKKSTIENDVIINSKKQTSININQYLTQISPIAETNSSSNNNKRPNLKQRHSFITNEDDLLTEFEAKGEDEILSATFNLLDSDAINTTINNAGLVLSSEDVQNELVNFKMSESEFLSDSGAINYYVAIYDYHPATQSPNRGTYESELKLKKGDLVAIFGECDQDGFFMGQLDNAIGTVPHNLIQKLELQDESLLNTSSGLLFQASKQVFSPHKFTAIYSYNPRDDSPNTDDMSDELSFSSGDSILIFGNAQGDGFYIGEKNGKMGFVPSNFVEASSTIEDTTQIQMDTTLDSSDHAATPLLDSSAELKQPQPKNIISKTKGIFRSLSKKH